MADTIAALFVETGGTYFNLEGVDPYDVKRNAMTYKGPYPVVAHPPCNLWVAFAHVNYKRWGGEHNRPGNDGGMFKFALDTVNKFGGVLEHPARSTAWKAHNLYTPKGIGWFREGRGWLCQVWQSVYGHKAAKSTTLYYVGKRKPFDLKWDRLPGEYQVGQKDTTRSDPSTNKKPLSSKEASRTPIEFRDTLIELARYSTYD